MDFGYILFLVIFLHFNTYLAYVADNTTIHHQTRLTDPQIFLSLAKSAVRENGDKLTDKVTEHKYQEMYGQFLLPVIKR